MPDDPDIDDRPDALDRLFEEALRLTREAVGSAPDAVPPVADEPAPCDEMF